MGAHRDDLVTCPAELLLERSGVPRVGGGIDQEGDLSQARAFSLWGEEFRRRRGHADGALAPDERDLLGSIVRDKTQRAQKIRLGKALSSARDRHFDHFRLVAGSEPAGRS